MMSAWLWNLATPMLARLAGSCQPLSTSLLLMFPVLGLD